MRYIIIITISLITLVSCRKDFDTIPNKGQLEFSKTTVYLDTVFTNISSSTYMLKVYNRSNDDINIPSIALGKGNSSKYRLMVDGLTGVDANGDGRGDGKLFSNIPLLAHDSLFVFVEATAGIADANTTDLLYTDQILFDNAALQQKVSLVTLIQDAIFLYPERQKNPKGNGYIYEALPIGSNPVQYIYGFFLDDTELTLTNKKPYVIYGYAAIPPGKTLNIQAGARIHFHNQSGIIVANTGSIQVNGDVSTNAKTLEKEVIFEGDRLEPEYAETAGQWGTIWLTNGSTNNSFNHLTIKNSTVGILIDNQDNTTVQIKNTQIYNSSNIGILARTAKINAENLVINKAGEYAMACTYGGTYDFTHCTFTNYWTGSSRQTPAILLDNTIKIDDVVYVKPLSANLYNSIVYGTNNIEIGLNKNESKTFTTNIKNCLIKFNDINNQYNNNLLYSFTTDLSNIIAKNNTNDPQFKDAPKNNLRIKTTSPAKDKGNTSYLIPTDADGKTRVTTDIGAYITQ